MGARLIIIRHCQGRPSLWDHDAFSPLFQIFPPISEKFSDFLKFFYNFTFSRKISWLSSAKFSDDLFFSHRPQISNFPPIFAVSVHFPLFRENVSFPIYFSKFPPCFRQIHLLFTYFTCISPLLWPWCIYASPNARTGRPCSCLSLLNIHVMFLSMYTIYSQANLQQVRC